MCEQIRRLDAHASHLLNGFLDLRAKYAMLDPMLFDKGLQGSMAGERARGFVLLRHTLFLSCAQDIAKLACDSDKRTPSITKILETLADEHLRTELRDSYSQCGPRAWANTESATPDVVAALAEIDARDEANRRTEYDEMYAELTRRWDALAASPALGAFRTVRDKISAHTEVRLIDAQYRVQDIEELGIKWTDLRDTIAEMQEIVKYIGRTVRSGSFDWNMYDDQLGRAATGFWRTPRD